MADWIRLMLTGCGLAIVLAAGAARADGGQIVFRGAIVAPTCATGSEPPGVLPAMSGPRRLACGSAKEIASGSASSYELTVLPLDGPGPTGDRLLDYFVGYLPSAVRAEARLVTRTYE